MRTIKNRNNEGRPPMAATEKLKYKITVRFATKEYFLLKEKARRVGVTLSEYLRRASASSGCVSDCAHSICTISCN